MAVPGTLTIRDVGEQCTRQIFEILTPCYICEAPRGRVVAPHLLKKDAPVIATHFFVRCQACGALWKIGVRGEIIDGAPPGPWERSFSDLGKGNRASRKIVDRLREASENLYSERPIAAAGILRGTIQLLVWAELLGLDVEHGNLPPWDASIRDCDKEFSHSTEDRNWFRDIKQELEEIHELGASSGHGKPHPGKPLPTVPRVTAAFSKMGSIVEAIIRRRSAAGS